MHGLEDGECGGIVEVGAELVLQAVLEDGGVRAEGFHHLDALGEHVALREFVGFGRGLLHDDAVRAGFGFGRQLADGHLAGAGLHVAEDAEAVVPAEDVFLGEVAVEVEAVEAERLGCADLFLGEFGDGEHAVQSPVAPGDRGVDFCALAVEAEDGVGGFGCAGSTPVTVKERKPKAMVRVS